MKILFYILVFFAFVSCSTKKNVYWCGDHACVNKKEKEAYFKKTMIVEVRSDDNINKKNKNEIEMIENQILSDEKKRIKQEKDLAKQIKLEKKRKIKEEKELAKQIKLEKKRKIKEEKELAKQIELEDKRRIKEEKKLSKIAKLEKKNEIKNMDLSEKVLINNDSDTEFSGTEYSKFNELVEKITKKNSFRPYPDINDIPN